MIRIGTHLSFNLDSYQNDFKKVLKNKTNVIQIYLANIINSKKLNKINIQQISDFIKKNKIELYIHSSYTVNIAKQWNKYSWWVSLLLAEFDLAHKIGAKGIVIHTGKKLSLTKQNAMNNMFSFITYIINQTKNTNVMLLLETSAGQGTEMLYKIEDFSYFYKKLKLIKTNRIGICIDSCHIFAAGYNLKNKEVIKNYLDLFDELIGLSEVKLIHLNDSQGKCGSRLDRHQSIGDGEIGLEGLIQFVYFFKKLNVPMVFETPYDSFSKELNKITQFFKK